VPADAFFGEDVEADSSDAAGCSDETLFDDF
jgi:hypothetical protein